MIIKLSNGRVIADEITEKSVYIKDGKIYAITNDEIKFDTEIDVCGNYISPGFVDIHCHGGGGADFMDGGVMAIKTAVKTHMMHGTTTIMPTTLTASPERYRQMIDDAKKAAEDDSIANIAGLHMEGPYFAPSQAGAQDLRYIKAPDKNEYSELVEYADGFIKKWSFAPELVGSEEFCQFLLKNGIVPSAGHTDATYDDVLRVYDAGLRDMTHFYSAMSGIVRKNGYRVCGAVEAGYLFDDVNVEVISDGCHLPPELLKMIYKIKGSDRICLITDAMRGAAMPEGKSVLGPVDNGLECIIEDGVAKMPDRTCFAGSVATMDRQVRTFYKKAGVELVNSVKMATATPARTMGFDTKGCIREGFDADIVVFDDDINVKTVIIKKGNDVKIYNK